MRVFALSDIHIDFPENSGWLESLSVLDYRDDILILAGDISDSLARLRWCFDTLVRRFRRVLYVPGNHDLWVIREGGTDSFGKFRLVCELAQACGVSTGPEQLGNMSIVPLLSWYDYSFGPPGEQILATWMDFQACVWPAGFGMADVTAYFLKLNETTVTGYSGAVITFSHFLPRIDLMPRFIPPAHRLVYPVLGTSRLDQQIRRIGACIHVYGHSHVNRKVDIDGITYINNALGYPHEQRIATRQLMCIYQDGVPGAPC
ncbi:metallophosphoesterase [Paraburkholderia aspalathi]|uniref:metallophosphoesterase n=1 Tax=Paraburkholderia aspalathi TaxID=1324617 RepID=UPI0038B7AA46